MKFIYRMFNKYRWMWVVLPVSLVCLSFCFSSQKKGEEDLQRVILQTLKSTHFNPVQVDDTFSNNVFELFLNRLDKNKRYFLASDFQEFEKYRYDLDDQANAGTYDFLNLVSSVFSERVNDIEGIVTEVLENKFDFSTNEEYIIDEDAREYIASMDELKEDWRKYLKLLTLEKYYSKVKAQEKTVQNKDTSYTVQPLDSLEFKSRSEVLKNQTQLFERLKKFDREKQLDFYINCMTAIFDPHTNYFPPKDKEDFDIRMSGKLEGIGAQLSQSNGEMKVEMIVPGSPSYLQGELKAGDIILKVAQKDSTPVDIQSMDLSDAVQLIRGKKGTTVILTVRKPDGTIMEIPIVRDVVIMEEGYAKSAIIKDGRKKYGYIYLPQFYLDMNDKNGRTCSKDVKEEVKKLMKEGVKGIVLDLRNNGGGSLQDVVDMTGLFVGKQPIVQAKYNAGRASVLVSREKLLYDGPLAIMVNKYSASASEIMAAALQDYNRAIIVGTDERTFGKGTVQRFLDLDRFAPPGKNYDFGSLKVTIQKFYRINGGTTQLTGVIPDVVFPDRYSSVEVGEETEDFPLKWSEIEPVEYNMDMPSQAKNIADAKSKANNRIEKSKVFNLVKDDSKRIKENRDRNTYTLNFEKYKLEQLAWSEQNEEYDKKMKENVVENELLGLKVDMESIKGDSTKIKIKNDWLNSYKKDIYLNETINILSDL